MAIKPQVAKQFDDAKLATMTEPLTVRVEKVKLGGQRMPIPLPETEDAPGQGSGIGWDKAAVRELEQFLVTQWSGGGVYSIKVTDAQNAVLEWTASYNVQEFPERTPPPLQADPAAMVYQQPIVNPLASKGRQQMVAFPHGLSHFGAMQQAAYPAMQPQPGYPYPMPPAPPYGTPMFQAWQQEARDRGESAELKAMRETLARQEREATEARHRAEIERERQAAQQRADAQAKQVDELRLLVTNLATSIQNAQSKPQANSELETIKLQLQAEREKADRDRQEREAERRERDTREMMKAMQDSQQRQFEAMQRQMESFQAALTAANANKSDPMIEMLRENARQSAEMIKSIASSHASAIEKMQATAMHPRDILQVAREASIQADQVTDKLTRSFGQVIDLQAKVTENALQMQPQGSPVVDLIRDGASKFGDLAERYFGKAELQQRLQAQQQQALLDAQRDVQIAQINAANPGLAGMQPQPQIESGLNGHPPAPTPRKRKGEKVVAENGKPITKKILGKTDQEWFGPALLPDINNLRMGVAIYLDALKSGETDKDGNTPGASAEDAATGIAQGVAIVTQMKMNIPAMTLLLFEQRYAEFMEVMLPDAPEQYRSDVINALIPILRGEVGGGEGMTGEEPQQADGEDEADSADEGDADPDDGTDAAQDGKPTPARGGNQVIPIRNGKPVSNPPRRA